ncbi:hypothetical protein OGAPHI_007025 [Ogataea philodendri]|uniref:Structure-specific endonuclease subunit SLX4 n=1 Tax=Ogataea philodendri TaxID=1378263 RepID=A0A9P8SZT5_9ASCO|nr:uncharacterized protein OGAPHI_007025 [Ogataea philodendri]KAH3660439.1 hypothetical protein OGAPHI_007025 [Ogataea philodendri]
MSDFLLGTQAQAQIEEWESNDGERKKLNSLKQKFSLAPSVPVKAKHKAALTRRPKIKSLGDQMSKKYGKKNDNVAVLLALSGKKRKVKDIIRSIARIEEKSTEKAQDLDEINLLYSKDEWVEVRDEITRNLPKLSKSAKMTLDLISEKYDKQRENKQLWQESSTPPLVFSKDEIQNLYDFEKDEKSFISSESDSEDLVVTLSQVMHREASEITGSEKSVPCTPEEDYKDSELSWITYETCAIQSRQLEGQRKQVYKVSDDSNLEVAGTQQDPIDLSSQAGGDIQVLDSVYLKSFEDPKTTGGEVEVVTSSPIQADEAVVIESSSPINREQSMTNKTTEEVSEEVFSMSAKSETPSLHGKSGHVSEDEFFSCTEFFADKLKEIDTLSKVEKVVPDSQPDYDELTIDFEKFSTQQLKKQITEWGLKPVRSRTQMVQLLNSTLKLIDRSQLKTVERTEAQGEGLLRFSQAELNKGYDDHQMTQSTIQTVRSSMFLNIRTILQNEPKLHRDILLLRPINFNEVTAVLEKNGLQMDAYTVRDFLDEMGICFTVKEDEIEVDNDEI